VPLRKLLSIDVVVKFSKRKRNREFERDPKRKKMGRMLTTRKETLLFIDNEKNSIQLLNTHHHQSIPHHDHSPIAHPQINQPTNQPTNQSTPHIQPTNPYVT
jgi:hypothetical protein